MVEEGIVGAVEDCEGRAPLPQEAHLPWPVDDLQLAERVGACAPVRSAYGAMEVDRVGRLRARCRGRKVPLFGRRQEGLAGKHEMTGRVVRAADIFRDDTERRGPGNAEGADRIASRGELDCDVSPERPAENVRVLCPKRLQHVLRHVDERL